MALKLRLKGRSYNEISKLLKAPKSTLSGWFSGLDLPDQARDRLSKRRQDGSFAGLLKHNKNQTHLAEQRARLARKEAKEAVGKLSGRDLFMIGVALYWAEGYKRPVIIKGRVKTAHSVRLTNSDPKLVSIFLSFLRKTCHVPEEKITASIHCYEHQSQAYLLDFWSTLTELPVGNFRKFYTGISKSSQGKRPFNILPYGTVQIAVNSTELYHRIMGWIDGLSQIRQIDFS